MGSELRVPWVYQEVEPLHERGRPPHWLDVPEEDLGKKLKELADYHDVMFLSPTENMPDHYRIYLDNKGKRFKQR